MAQTLEAAEQRPELEDTVPRRSRARSLLPLAVCVTVAGAIALLSKALLFPLFSGNSDESVYIYQARMLTQGHVTLAARTHEPFFHPWLFGLRGDRLFPQYQPAWPTIIAIGHALGNEKIALVIAAAAVTAAVWFLAQEISPGSGVFAAGIFVASPIFIVHSGTYLPYLWTTALVAGAAAGVLAGIRTGKRWPYVVGGALFGVAQLTRPFDALIFAVPTAAYLAFRLWHEPSDLRRAAAGVAIGLVPFLLVTAVYNTHITGGPLRFPLQTASPLDTFGFGPRKLMPDAAPYKYTAAKALTGLQDNTIAIPRWLAGCGIGFALAIAAVTLRRRRAEAWLMVVFALVFPLVYFFWWGTALSAAGSRNGLGPHYYVPAFAPLAVLAGWSMQMLYARSRALTALVACALVAGTALVLPGMRDNAHYTEQVARKKRDAILSNRLSNAVVVLRADRNGYTLVGTQFLVGDPALKDNVVYAADRGPAVADLPNRVPGRTVYQWVQRGDPGQPIGAEKNFFEPLSVARGKTVTLHFQVKNTDDRPVTTAYVSFNGEVVASTTLDTSSHRGDVHNVEIVLGGPGAPLPHGTRPGRLVVPVPDEGVIQVGAGFGPDTDLDNADLFEQRYFAGFEKGHPELLAVQKPGLQFHLYREPIEDWLAENVEPHLAEVP